MIQTIEADRRLNKYLHRVIEDAGIEARGDESLTEEEYVGIKIDDYYMGQRLGGETPKAVDFIVTVDCGFDWYALYVLEMKDTGSYTTTEIEEKFDTAMYRFMQEEYKTIFLNDKYKYKDIKLYLITTANKAALKFPDYMTWLKIRNKINNRDTLELDRYQGAKLYCFRDKICRIEKETPPNPLIHKIL